MKNKINIYEERLELYERDNGICVFCKKPVLVNDFQVSHLIANAKWARKKYGGCVIDHPLNKACTHPGKCNDGMLITFNPVKTNELVEKIRDALLKE
jgi:hypothetical protein